MENLAKHTPYLLTTFNHNNKEDAYFTLYNIADKIHYEFDEPYLHEKSIIGSQYGWLVVLDQHSETFLLNPLTHESIPLPSITAIRKIRPCHSIISGDMVAYFVCTCFILEFPFYKFTLNYFRQQFTLRKVVVSSNPSISSSNFNVAALYDFPISHLVVTREGEGRWNLLEEIDVSYMDIMFRQDGKLLCLTCMGALREVEFKDNDIVITDISPPNLSRFFQVGDFDNVYLAEDCAGRVLAIVRTCGYRYSDDSLTILDVKVFRFIRGNKEESKWEPLITLDGEAIFVDSNASVWLAKEDIHGEINVRLIWCNSNQFKKKLCANCSRINTAKALLTCIHHLAVSLVLVEEGWAVLRNGAQQSPSKQSLVPNLSLDHEFSRVIIFNGETMVAKHNTYAENSSRFAWRLNAYLY